MKSVANVFGRQHRRQFSKVEREWVLNTCLMGVEIEVELGDNVSAPTQAMPMWSRKNDGSLRNGYEYVMTEPRCGNDLATAINIIFEQSKFQRSMTGSTHIHMDMMEEEVTPAIIQTMVFMIFVLEPAIFAIADPGREWCGYTNKLSSAPPVLISAIMNLGDGNLDDLVALCRGDFGVGRYYGLNLMALNKFGSLEFRYFPTATSEQELADWINLVQSFKLAALSVGSVPELVSILTNHNKYTDFITNFFSQWADVFLKEVPEIAALQATHKALAIASTYNVDHEPYDAGAILNNKAFKKFVKVTKSTETEVPVQMRIYRNSERTNPEASNVELGTVICYGGTFHWTYNRGSGWDTFDARFLDSYHVDLQYVAASFFQESVESFSARLVQVGYSIMAVEQALLRFNTAKEFFNSRGLLTGTTGTIIPPLAEPNKKVKLLARGVNIQPTDTVFAVDGTSWMEEPIATTDNDDDDDDDNDYMDGDYV